MGARVPLVPSFGLGSRKWGSALMRVSWLLVMAVAFSVPTLATAIAETADNLAIQARALHEAAGLETDPEKRLSLLRHTRKTLERIAIEDPGDPYAKRLSSGEAILGLTIAGIDREISTIEREKKRLTGTPGSYIALFRSE